MPYAIKAYWNTAPSHVRYLPVFTLIKSPASSYHKRARADSVSRLVPSAEENGKALKLASQGFSLLLEAPSRFELENKGFADLRLTTWLWRRLACYPRLVIITLLRSFPCSPFSVPLSRQNPQVLEEKEGLRSGVRRRGLPPATNEAQPIPTWSGRRDSDSRPQPWQGCALPTELLPQNGALGRN